MKSKKTNYQTQNSKILSLAIGHWKLQSGQMLLITIIFLALVLIISASLFSRVAGFLRFGVRSIYKEQAIVLAEAGIERALWQLNQTAGSYTGESNTTLGTTGTFTVSIANKSQTLKTITATGFVPNNSTPRAKQTIKVDALITSEIISFRYAVQVGNGGISMANSATINGTVFSNKPGTNSIEGSGQTQINGDAYAVGTISTPSPFITGIKYENQTPTEMPTVDYQYWKDIATAGGTTVCSPTCSISGDNVEIGPRKYQGNLSISNQAKVFVKGPVYVTGDVDVRNGGTEVNLDESFGSLSTALIIDGDVNVEQGGAFNPTSANPKGYILVISLSNASDALTIRNSGANAVFYALEGSAVLTQSATVNSLVAGSITMSQTAVLNYDTGLASTQFSSGPGASWIIKKGTYRFTSSP